MKRKIFISSLIVLIVSAVVAVFANGIKNKQVVLEQSDSLQIVVTSFPQYDFVRAITRETADIHMLIKPGAETHSFEPTPQDIKLIQNSDLFVYTGGENDKWVEGILGSIDTNKTNIVRLMDCVELLEEDETLGLEGVKVHTHDEHDEHEHKHSSTDIEYDEHIWTSPKNAIEIIEKLESVICELDKNDENLYRKNAKEYIAQIEEIDVQIRDIVDNAKRKTLVFGDRFPFKYFVEEYGLDYKAAFPGCSEEMEPSAETISYLVNYINKEKIPVVLYVELSSQKVADTLSKETNTQTMCLNSVHNATKQDFENGVTYVSKMRENLKTLKAALQ